MTSRAFWLPSSSSSSSNKSCRGRRGLRPVILLPLILLRPLLRWLHKLGIALVGAGLQLGL